MERDTVSPRPARSPVTSVANLESHCKAMVLKRKICAGEKHNEDAEDEVNYDDCNDCDNDNSFRVETLRSHSRKKRRVKEDIVLVR